MKFNKNEIIIIRDSLEHYYHIMIKQTKNEKLKEKLKGLIKDIKAYVRLVN